MPSYNSGQIASVGFMVNAAGADQEIKVKLDTLRFRKKRIGLVTTKGFKFGVAKTHPKQYLCAGKFKHAEPTTNNTPSIKM